MAQRLGSAVRLAVMMIASDMERTPDGGKKLVQIEHFRRVFVCGDKMANATEKRLRFRIIQCDTETGIDHLHGARAGMFAEHNAV